MDSAEICRPLAVTEESPILPRADAPAAKDLAGALHPLAQSVAGHVADVRQTLMGAAQLIDATQSQVRSMSIVMEQIMPPVAAAAEAAKQGQTWSLVAAISAKIGGKVMLVYFVFVMFLLIRSL